VADQPETPGGSGGESLPTARDTRMLEKAVRQRWPIAPEARPKIVKVLTDIAESADASPRNREIAARILVQMDALNMEQERRDLNLADQVNVHVTGSVSIDPAEVVAAGIDIEQRRRQASPSTNGNGTGNGHVAGS
jgi:hypothetical protein